MLPCFFGLWHGFDLALQRKAVAKLGSHSYFVGRWLAASVFVRFEFIEAAEDKRPYGRELRVRILAVIHRK